MNTRTLRPLRILVVEDAAETAHTTQILLTLWGYDCLMARDGPAALEVAATFCPGVVLLDIGLPGVDGYEVARRLREHPATAEALLVAVTGYGQEHEVRRCREAGFDRHLLKPVEPQELRTLLAEQAARSCPREEPGKEAPLLP
jgi:CheY-like chemotaxis protein